MKKVFLIMFILSTILLTASCKIESHQQSQEELEKIGPKMAYLQTYLEHLDKMSEIREQYIKLRQEESELNWNDPLYEELQEKIINNRNAGIFHATQMIAVDVPPEYEEFHSLILSSLELEIEMMSLEIESILEKDINKLYKALELQDQILEYHEKAREEMSKWE